MMLGKTSLKMVSQEVVQTEFSVVHGLTRMHGLTRNEDTCIVMIVNTARLSIKFLNIGIESFLAGLSQISSFLSL